MSTVVFPFHFQKRHDYIEELFSLDDFERSVGGRSAVVARAGDRMFRVANAVLTLPDKTEDLQATPEANTPASFEAFVEARNGRVDTFLYRALEAHHRQVADGALGTGDGSTTVFAFSDGTDLHKHLDLTTLVVKVDGVVKAITTDYTVSGNDSDPTITFLAAPGNTLAITVDYIFYMPVRFSAIAKSRILRKRGTDDLDNPEVVQLVVSLEEDAPGMRFAGVT